MSLLLYPELRDCRCLFLRDFITPAYIGVYDSEKGIPQRVRINIELYIPLSASTPHQDQLDEVIDYDVMRETVVNRLSQGHIQLQETLCDDIVSTLLALSSVKAVRMTSEKLDVYLDCNAVGVEVFRIKS